MLVCIWLDDELQEEMVATGCSIEQARTAALEQGWQEHWRLYDDPDYILEMPGEALSFPWHPTSPE